MFKRQLLAFGFALTAISLGFVQVYSPVANSLSVHTEHRNTGACHSFCSTPAERRKEPTPLVEDDDEPSPTLTYVNAIRIESIGVGLLDEHNIWRQSSWVPPDLTLLSGQYSTAL